MSGYEYTTMILFILPTQLNMDIDENIVTLEQVQESYSFIKSCPDVVRTPLISNVQNLFKESIRENGPDLSKMDLFMKMENMQITGKYLNIS